MTKGIGVTDQALTSFSSTKRLVAKRLVPISILVFGLIFGITSNAFANNFSEIQNNLDQQSVIASKLEVSQNNVESKVKTFMEVRKLWTASFQQFVEDYKQKPASAITIHEANFALLKTAKNDLVTALSVYKEASDAFIELKRAYWLLGADSISKSMGLKDPRAIETVKQSALSRWRNNDQLPQLETYNSVVVLLDPYIKDFESAEKCFLDLMNKARTAEAEARTRAEAEARARAQAEAAALAEAEAAALAEAEAAALAEAEAAAATSKKRTINCVKGRTSKKISALSPKCPKGYKKK